MRHQHISFIKSIVRIIGYIVLYFVSQPAAIILILSEILGISEEIGHE